MNEFLKSLEEMNIAQIEERLALWEKEVRDAKSKEELAEKEEQLNAMQERLAELKDLEERKGAAIALNNGEVTGKKVEERKVKVEMSEVEVRAKDFMKSGRMEMRAVLATGKIAKPGKVSGGINDLAEVASDIVDDVNAVALTGTGSWTVAYKKTNATAAAVTDGNKIGGTGSTYDYVTINPSEWGVLDQVSNQVKKMSPLNYLDAVEKSALIALRTEASNKIVAAIKASALAKKVNGIALDADYLKNLVLGFRAHKNKGDVYLYIAQADLLTLGKVRGTNEKKALFDIAFDEGSTTSGVIKEGGMAVKFRVLDQLEAGEQLFGQPGAVDMPMWDGYEINTDEGGEYFAKNQICVRGIQTAGADLVAFEGMCVVKQAAE